MSYTQTFKGSFTYADPHLLEAALDAFASGRANVLLRIRDLELSDRAVTIDYDCSAPASMYDDTLDALGRLGQLAASGRIDTTFHLDGVSRSHVGSSGRKSVAGLPPRHHRWELYRAAKRGDAVALRALRTSGVDFGAALSGTSAD